MTNVTIYTKDNCMPCKMMKEQLEKNGIVPNEVNIDRDESAIDQVRSLGFSTVPVVQAGKMVFNGFQPHMIPKLMKQGA